MESRNDKWEESIFSCGTQKDRKQRRTELKTHIILIFRLIILFWVTSRIGLHELMFRKHIVFLKLFSAAALYSLSSQAPSIVIGQLTHAWAITAYHNRVDVQNQFICAKLAARHKLCKCITSWCSVMSQSHRIKEATTDYFRGSVFCGREETVARSFTWTQTYKTLKERQIKNIRGLLLVCPHSGQWYRDSGRELVQLERFPPSAESTREKDLCECFVLQSEFMCVWNAVLSN